MSPAKEKAAIAYVHAVAWASDQLAQWHAAATAPDATDRNERRRQNDLRRNLQPEVINWQRTGKKVGDWIWKVVEDAHKKYLNTP